MNIARFLRALHDAEPVRLWLYSVVTTVILPALALAGWATDQWIAFAITAAGTVLGTRVVGEVIRDAVYSPATLAEFGVIDLPARDVRVVDLEPGGPAVELDDDTREIPALFRVLPPRPRPAA